LSLLTAAPDATLRVVALAVGLAFVIEVGLGWQLRQLGL
jgi:hypothetical protein